MFSITVDYQGFEALEQALRDVELKAFDLEPLAEQIRTVMIDDNAARTLAGVDLNDVEFFPLKAETLLRRGGTGPPLAPQGAGSQLMAGYDVQVHRVSPHQVNVVGRWPTMPFLKYHVTGYTSRGGNFVPARNPAGLTPRGGDLVIDRFASFLDDILSPLGGPP